MSFLTNMLAGVFKSLKLQVILKRLGRTALYTLLTMVIGYLTLGLETFVPDGNMESILWKILLLPLITGAIAGLDKLRRWKP